MKRISINIIFAVAFIGAALTSCKKEAIIEGGNELSDWTAETHGYGATPNYDIVFNQNEVQRLDLVITPEYWQAMEDDMESIYGGLSGGPGGAVGSSETPTMSESDIKGTPVLVLLI